VLQCGWACATNPTQGFGHARQVFDGKLQGAACFSAAGPQCGLGVPKGASRAKKGSVLAGVQHHGGDTHLCGETRRNHIEGWGASAGVFVCVHGCGRMRALTWPGARPPMRKGRHWRCGEAERQGGHELGASISFELCKARAWLARACTWAESRPLAGHDGAVKCSSTRRTELYGGEAGVARTGRVVWARVCARTRARELSARETCNGSKATAWCGCARASASGSVTTARAE
jgi:hypothetical protein